MDQLQGQIVRAAIKGGVVTHHDGGTLFRAVCLVMFGRKGLEYDLRMVRAALKHAQQRMRDSRRSFYRPEAEWDLGPGFSPKTSAIFREGVERSYRIGKRWEIKMCLELRRKARDLQAILERWDAEEACDPSTGEVFSCRSSQG